MNDDEVSNKWNALCEGAALTANEAADVHKFINDATDTFIKRYGGDQIEKMDFESCQRYVADEFIRHSCKKENGCDLIIKLYECNMFEKFMKFYTEIYFDAVKNPKKH